MGLSDDVTDVPLALSEISEPKTQLLRRTNPDKVQPKGHIACNWSNNKISGNGRKSECPRGPGYFRRSHSHEVRRAGARVRKKTSPGFSPKRNNATSMPTPVSSRRRVH